MRLAASLLFAVALTVGFGGSWAGAAPEEQTFTADDTFTVPAGVTCLTVTASGGSGGAGVLGNGQPDADGGAGAVVVAVFPVTPGEDLDIVVGSGGDDGVNNEFQIPVGAGGAGGASSFGSGGDGGDGFEVELAAAGGGGGGGASAVLRSGAPLVVAGGGGGGGASAQS